MAKYNPFDPANGYSEEDRLALNGKCASLINQAYKNPFPGTKIRLDGADNAGIFFAKQLAHVKTKAYDKDFPELSGLKIFPQTSETDEGAAYIEYYSYEPVGFADVIANYASDLPRVDAKGTPHRAEIVNIGDSYGYNVQELRACRRNAVLGIMKSLDSARAEAARRVYDVKVNHLIWHGDEKTGIIGVLSSGKSTCMNIIGCLDVPTHGRYLLDGSDVGKMNRRELAAIRNEKLGFIFQQYNLLPKLTLLENVEVPLIYAGVGGSERRSRAIAALEQVGLGSKLRNKPNQLSGGQQQRVSIARALVRNPPIILADEPTGALDSHTGREVLGMLQELHKQGHTVVLITHDNSIAVQAERIIRLEDGVVVYDGDAHAPEAVVQPNLMMSAPKAGEEGANA